MFPHKELISFIRFPHPQHIHQQIFAKYLLLSKQKEKELYLILRGFQDSWADQIRSAWPSEALLGGTP